MQPIKDTTKQMEEITRLVNYASENMGNDVLLSQIVDDLSPLFASEKRRLLQEIEEEVKKRRKNLAIIITADGKEAMTVDEWQTKGYNTAMDEIKKIISSMK